MKKRFVSVILTLCMVLGMVPLKAFAVESGAFTEPKVTQLTVSYDGGEPVDLLGNQPTVSMPAGSKPVFTVTFDSTELLNKVFVTSTKDGETKYLEATLQDGKYVTDSYFDPNDTNYIPGTIAVTYSKKILKIDESGNIGGTDLNTLKTQLTAQDVSSRNEATGADGTVTAEIVLGDTFGAMANVYFDAAVSEFTDGAGIDQSELDRWLGVYQNLSQLSSYDLESTDGKQFTLYLGDGKDFGDPDTYLVMIKDATSNKYTRTLLQKGADKAGLGDISNALSSANLVVTKLLEYNAISKDTAALREEIEAHPTMTQQEKMEANEKITALDRDKKLFMMGMMAVSLMTASVGGAPLVITAIMAGYSSMADYFWEHRVGLIKGCNQIENIFSDSGDHPGWKELDNYYIDESGSYYLSSNWNLLQVSENTKVTLCLHGHAINGVVTMKEGSTLQIRDCKYAKHDDESVTGGMINRTILMKGQNELTLEQGIIQGNYGHAIVSEGNSGKITINGGIIEGVNGSIIADDGGNGEITINGGVLKHSGSMGYGIRINNGSKLIINGGIINCEGAIYTYDANGNSNAVIQINGGEITGGIRAGTGQLSISHGKVYGNISNSNCAATTLLIQNNSDIQVSGTSAFSKAPTVKAGTGYTGGVTYYNSVTGQGTPMTIEEAAKAGYTGPYVRLVADGSGSSGDCEHTYTAVVTAPTCTERGYTTHTCSLCGMSYKDSYTDALGHSYGEWVVTAAATATADGQRERICSRCSNKETEIIPATGDSPSGESGGNTWYPSTPSSTTTTTTNNPDGSTTATVTNKTTGVVTQTTRWPDGRQEKTVTQADGSKQFDNKAANGTTASGTIAANGRVEGTVKVSGKAVTDANGGPMELPLPNVPVAADSAAASTIKVDLPNNAGADVAIPVSGSNPGAVALLVNSDGTETVLKKSALVNGKLYVPLTGDSTVKIVDNSKNFSDMGGHWSADAVTFVTSRELFEGDGNGNFMPNNTMTRAMLVTVLHRLENPPAGAGMSFDDVANGLWYTNAVSWAAENKIVEGHNGSFNPSSNVTREQIAAILYRYAKAIGAATPERGSLASFLDGDSTSGWAKEAMSWAVGAGLFSGSDGGRLNPGGNATRAEVATILMRFVEHMVK